MAIASSIACNCSNSSRGSRNLNNIGKDEFAMTKCFYVAEVSFAKHPFQCFGFLSSFLDRKTGILLGKYY